MKHALLLLAFLSMGCRQVLAPSGDLADYRAFRVAAHEGTRLSRAQAYLKEHPNGRFVDEVRAAFEVEEPRYFETAQQSRENARRYLANLPNGPHAEAAVAMLVAFDSSMQDAELRDIARRVLYEDAKLESAAKQRRAIGESILTAVGVFQEDAILGKPRTEGPIELRDLMRGPTPTTMGTVPATREEDFFFLLPTRPERESRLLTLEISVIEENGLVVGGRLEGSDVFIRWAEADQIVKLDPSSPDDRTESLVHAQDRLGGAFEARFPAKTCPDAPQGKELLHRTCNGWEVIVTPGSSAGDKDSIVIRGRKAANR